MKSLESTGECLLCLHLQTQQVAVSLTGSMKKISISKKAGKLSFNPTFTYPEWEQQSDAPIFI